MSPDPKTVSRTGTIPMVFYQHLLRYTPDTPKNQNAHVMAITTAILISGSIGLLNILILGVTMMFTFPHTTTSQWSDVRHHKRCNYNCNRLVPPLLLRQILPPLQVSG